MGKLVEIFREVRRVLRKDGTVWLNLGDSYTSGNSGQTVRDASGGVGGGRVRETHDLPSSRANPGRAPVAGMKPKDLVGIPWMVAFALRADGWYLRSDIIWSKLNPMPESVTDRPTKSHEYIFLLAKSQKYFFDQDAVRERWTCDRDDMRENGIRTGVAYFDQKPGQSNSTPPSHKGSTFTKGKTAATKPTVGHGERNDNPAGRNIRTVWTIATSPFSDAHFATFPPDLIKPCILAGTSARGCCAECGAPWERVTERNTYNKEGWGAATKDHHGPIMGSQSIIRDGNGRAGDTVTKTTGWQPTCKHEGEPVPCTVIDPFAGSGTTGKVAIELGRKAILIEPKAEYCEMIEKRCRTTIGLPWMA